MIPSRRSKTLPSVSALSGHGEGGRIHTVELYRQGPSACRDGMSERAAARHFGVSRESVRKMLEFPSRRGTDAQRRCAVRSSMDLPDSSTVVAGGSQGGPSQAAAHREAHLRASSRRARLHRRVHDREGPCSRESSPASGDVRAAGSSAGARAGRFGEAWAFIGGVKQKVHFFAFDLPHSDASYVRAYPAATARHGSTGTCTRSRSSARSRCRFSTTTTGAWCRGSSVTGRAGARDCSADSSRTTSSGTGTVAPARATTRGRVEGLVGWSRRNFMVPLPRFASLEAFNEYLEQRCRERQGDVLRGHRERIGERLKRDLEAMAALPAAPFDACHQAPGQVSSQSLVRFQTNDYSVPVRLRISPGVGARLRRAGGDRVRHGDHRSPPPVLRARRHRL